MVKIGMLIADRYEVLEKIGTGGMSVVYKAKDHKLNRFVAVKILKQEFSDNANFVSKFRAEAQAAAGLMHPNIVNVYDVGEEKGMNYIVMELVDGITLKKYIEKKQRLSTKEAISIAIQVSQGLQSAHHNHIIHRDIKPQNIMISRDGKVKIADFGIAKAATSNTITSNVMGSVHYTSPEQARGGYSDERSDIYSLGITIYEMLTGRVPFNGETTVAIAIKHIQTPMPSPRDLVPDVPHSVEQIVLKCCEKSPDRRYQSMEELIADLKQSLIHPEDDFVKVIIPDEEGATRMASGRETQAIRRRDLNYAPEDYEEVPEGEESGYEEDYAPYEEPAPVRAGESSRRPDRRVRKRYDEDDYTDDFDDGRTYSRGRDRRITVFSVIAAILIGVIIIVIAAVKLGVITPGGDASAEAVSAVQSGETVSMPDVAGKDAEEARQQLQQLGLVVETTWAESDQYDSGLVISSSVEAGQSVAAGTSVVLTVSAGQNGIEVPYVTGLTRPEAKATLEKKGLRVDVQEEFSDTVEKDSVLSQDPAAGVSIPSGSTVTITVSSGPDTEGKIAVPSLYGMSADEARQALESAGLAIGNTTTQDTDDDTLVDKVLSQDIVKDTMVDPGTAVSVVIGTGTAKATYSYSGSIPAPTAEEAPDYVPGTQVYIVLFADDGTKLLDTTTTEFPYGPVSYVGLSSASGTLSMSYVSAAGDANGGSKTIQRVIQFTPEQ